MNTEKPVTADFASNPMSLSNSKRDITTVASSTKSLLGQKKKEKITSHDFRVSHMQVKETNCWSDISNISLCPCGSSALLHIWSVRKIKLR